MRRGCAGVIRHGTAKDAADVGVGYVASGASEHSRNVAHGNTEKLPSHGARRRNKDPDGPRYATLSLVEKIKVQRTELAKLNFRLCSERDPDKRAKLQKNVDIKSRFLARLEHDQ